MISAGLLLADCYFGLRSFFVDIHAKGVSAHFDFKGIVKEPVAKSVGEGRFPHGRVPVLSGELASQNSGGLAVTIFDDFEEVGPFLVGEGRQEDVVDDKDVGLGKFGEELEP